MGMIAWIKSKLQKEELPVEEPVVEQQVVEEQAPVEVAPIACCREPVECSTHEDERETRIRRKSREALRKLAKQGKWLSVDNSEAVLDEIRQHLKTYYGRYISKFSLDVDDLVQSVYLKLLSGTCQNINTACQTSVRTEIKYHTRFILYGDPEVASNQVAIE